MKGNWTYKESALLKQVVAFDKDSGYLKCQDGTLYSPNELKLLKNVKVNDSYLLVHLIKKTFSGELISAGQKE